MLYFCRFRTKRLLQSEASAAQNPIPPTLEPTTATHRTTVSVRQDKVARCCCLNATRAEEEDDNKTINNRHKWNQWPNRELQYVIVDSWGQSVGGGGGTATESPSHPEEEVEEMNKGRVVG